MRARAGAASPAADEGLYRKLRLAYIPHWHAYYNSATKR